MDESLRRIAYLKGLADGYEINGKSKEGKLLLEIIDTLEVIAEDYEDRISELEEYVDILEDDLSDVEEFIFGDDDDFDFDLYDDDDYSDFDDFDEEDIDEEVHVEEE